METSFPAAIMRLAQQCLSPWNVNSGNGSSCVLIF
jgi:hypothetical protein